MFEAGLVLGVFACLVAQIGLVFLAQHLLSAPKLLKEPRKRRTKAEMMAASSGKSEENVAVSGDIYSGEDEELQPETDEEQEPPRPQPGTTIKGPDGRDYVVVR